MLSPSRPSSPSVTTICSDDAVVVVVDTRTMTFRYYFITNAGY